MTPSPVGGRATPTLPTTCERSGSVAIQAAFSPYTQPCTARPAANEAATSSQVLDVVLLAPGGEELGDVAVLLEGRRRREVVAVLLLERGLRVRVLEQVLAVQVDLDEGLHRHAVDVAGLGVLEVVDEAREVVEAEVGRLQLRIVLRGLGQVDQKVARQIAVDDVLLDVDEVIDAGLGLHVLDRLVVHLVPGSDLELDLDSGKALELLGQDVLDVSGRRR